jgi:hypothetical protein
MNTFQLEECIASASTESSSAFPSTPGAAVSERVINAMTPWVTAPIPAPTRESASIPSNRRVHRRLSIVGPSDARSGFWTGSDADFDLVVAARRVGGSRNLAASIPPIVTNPTVASGWREIHTVGERTRTALPQTPSAVLMAAARDSAAWRRKYWSQGVSSGRSLL